MKVISACLVAVLLLLLLGLLQEISARATAGVAPRPPHPRRRDDDSLQRTTSTSTSTSSAAGDGENRVGGDDNNDNDDDDIGDDLNDGGGGGSSEGDDDDDNDGDQLHHKKDSDVMVSNTRRAKYPLLFGVNDLDIGPTSSEEEEEEEEEEKQVIVNNVKNLPRPEDDLEDDEDNESDLDDDEEEDDEDDDDDDEEDDDDDDYDDGDRDYEWSEADLEMIKQKILDGLGLTTVPQKTKANFTKDEYDQAYSEYIRLVQEEEARMADSILKELDEEDEEEESELLKELEGAQASPLLSDYRFYSTGVSQHSKKHGRGRRSASRVEGQIVHFQVAVPVRRVYSHNLDVKQASCRLWKTGGSAPDPPGPDTITVKVFKMNDGGRRRRRRKQEPVLIRSMNVSVTGDEWLSVDVTEAVREWVNAPRGEVGVLIQCPDCGSAGVVIHTGANNSNSTYVPTLDVQTQVAAGRRVKRSKELTRATKAKWRRRGDCRNTKRNGNRRSRCCRRSMKVRFRDLPSFDFVESPEEFDAYYCSGRCPARFNPANEHALLQSLLKLQRREEIPRPCCAPTALEGLHILHVNEQGKLTTTYWSDVIVTECGCA